MEVGSNGSAPVNQGRRGSGSRGNLRGESIGQNRTSMDQWESPPYSSLSPTQPPPQEFVNPWPVSGPSSSSNLWGYPPQSGFVNLLQQPFIPSVPQGENFHFTGLINQGFNGTSPAPCCKGTPTPKGPADKQSKSRKKRINIDIDDDDGVEAKSKKRWTHDEQVRLANAWLNSSNDPLHGSDKKGETFWKQITEEFNKKAPENQTRDSNQLKIYWSRLKTAINDFNGFWNTVTKLHTSGYSEDQLMDEAQKLYTSKHGKPFALVHWWRTLKNEPKWCAYVSRLEKEKKKTDTIDITDDRDQPRPIGREAAKAQLRGKRKKEEVMEGIVLLGDNLNKIVDMQKERKVEREKVSQTQLEISKTNLKAAKEQKEAKLLEVYNSMLKQDTTNLTEAQIARREKMLEKMEAKLFADDLGEE